MPTDEVQLSLVFIRSALVSMDSVPTAASGSQITTVPHAELQLWGVVRGKEKLNNI